MRCRSLVVCAILGNDNHDTMGTRGLDHWADIVVVAVYFVFVLTVGLWVSYTLLSTIVQLLKYYPHLPWPNHPLYIAFASSNLAFAPVATAIHQEVDVLFVIDRWMPCSHQLSSVRKEKMLMALKSMETNTKIK